MSSVITQWVNEDIVAQVELVSQINQILALDLNSNEEADWREVIILFLKQSRIPKDPGQAQQIQGRVANFTLIDINLYKWAFSHSSLKCLGPEEAGYIL